MHRHAAMIDYTTFILSYAVLSFLCRPPTHQPARTRLYLPRPEQTLATDRPSACNEQAATGLCAAAVLTRSNFGHRCERVNHLGVWSSTWLSRVVCSVGVYRTHSALCEEFGFAFKAEVQPVVATFDTARRCSLWDTHAIRLGDHCSLVLRFSCAPRGDAAADGTRGGSIGVVDERHGHSHGWRDDSVLLPGALADSGCRPHRRLLNVKAAAMLVGLGQSRADAVVAGGTVALLCVL